MPWPQTEVPIKVMTDILNLHDSGGIFFAQEFTLLVYPAGNESWKFIDHIFPPHSPKASLRFVMRYPIPELLTYTLMNTSAESKAPIMNGETGPNALFRQYFGVEYAKLLPPAKKKNEHPQTFFLMYPPGLQEECDIIVKFLHANNATVFSAAKTGAWDYFANAVDAGVVLVSPRAVLSTLNMRSP